MCIFAYFIIFLEFFQTFLLILNNFRSINIYEKNIHRYFFNIFDISVKSKYRYICNYRYFHLCVVEYLDYNTIQTPLANINCNLIKYEIYVVFFKRDSNVHHYVIFFNLGFCTYILIRRLFI